MALSNWWKDRLHRLRTSRLIACSDISVAGDQCQSPTYRPLAHYVLPLNRPSVTAPSIPGNSPDGVKRSYVGGDEKVHNSDEQWQSPQLTNLRGKYGVDNAILSRRPC